MLSQVSSQYPASQHSFLDDGRNPPADKTLGMEDRLCPGCKKSVVNDNGGLVVAFGYVSFPTPNYSSGSRRCQNYRDISLHATSVSSDLLHSRQSFFHVGCFKCAKCGNQVTADTNLLLLSDGSPICANCSYSCSVCRLPILDEAIMTGDDSYHAHCFKCKVCKNRIDELVFAKTTQGIYCMNCHSERMIKIRRHAQKKAEREKAAGGSASSRTREQDARNFHRENGVRRSYCLYLRLTLSICFLCKFIDGYSASRSIFALALRKSSCCRTITPRRCSFSFNTIR